MSIQACFLCDRCNASFVGSAGDAVQRGYRRVTVGEPTESAPSREHTVVREFCAACMAAFARFIAEGFLPAEPVQPATWNEAQPVQPEESAASTWPEEE